MKNAVTNKIITYDFADDFIDNLSQYIKNQFYVKDTDLSRLAIVFGGKRPALFLKRALGLKFQNSFISPRFFSIDEFMGYIADERNKISRLSDLEACFTIFSLTKKRVPEILKTRKKFSDFLPWAREIASFIDQLDLENISNERLENVEKNAQIGYEVPLAINKLLENIVVLRKLYHEEMQTKNKVSRGMLYLTASRICKRISLDEFTQVLFCSFFDLHQTEIQVLKHYFDNNKATLFFQGDQENWPQLEELAALFGQKIEIEKTDSKAYISPNIKLYAGFDVHSQVCIVREVIKKINDKNSTVIVLPQSDNVIPLLTEISSFVKDFNVSMGYPLRRSTIYGLFDAIYRAQKTKKKIEYYSRDYLEVIKHPLLKNLNIFKKPVVTRLLVHKIEELILGLKESEIGGSLFLKLKSLEMLDELYKIVQDELKGMGISVNLQDLKKVLKELHRLAFDMWEDVSTLGEFSKIVNDFQDQLIKSSQIKIYPMNIKVLNRIYSLTDQFKNRLISNEKFSQLEIFKIFDEFLASEKIAFTGTPLKGLQILGLFESRSISFENVIIMDANESILPRLNAAEPLVPRAVMIGLGLDRLEEEEGIQQYQFMRLIQSAKNVHLIFNDNPDMEKSRFIENIIWQEEKKTNSLNTLSPLKGMFDVEVMQAKKSVMKNKNIEKILKNFIFSASSINVYLNCPMKFYYQYMLRLEEKEDLLDELESREVGIFIHEFLEKAFKPFLNRKININETFKKRFFHEFEICFKKDFSKRMKSDAFMLEQIMRYRLERFLQNEKERDIESILGLEQDMLKEINLGNRKIQFKCRIDRIERIKPDIIQVLDYKTGSSDAVPQGLKKLRIAASSPARSIIKKAMQSFQLPLYLYCVQDKYPQDKICTALYNLRTLKFSEFPKTKEFDEKDEIMQLSLDMLQFIVEEIYNWEIPFQPDENEVSCKYCPFSGVCK